MPWLCLVRTPLLIPSHTFVEPASNPLCIALAIVQSPAHCIDSVHLNGEGRREDGAKHDSIAAEEGAARKLAVAIGSEEVRARTCKCLM